MGLKIYFYHKPTNIKIHIVSQILSQFLLQYRANNFKENKEEQQEIKKGE